MALRITRVEVRNFRSIRNLVIEPKDLAIFVGKNDSGKSNVLRALNLFFNGETNPDEYLDFDIDHNIFNEPVRQAKEIIVKLNIELPPTYRATSGDFVVWEKRWRSDWDEPTLDEYVGRRFREGRAGALITDLVDIPNRARVHTLLRRIQYVYIPAIKDREYFSGLRASIYGTVAQAAARQFRDSSEAFEQSIANHLSDLTESITRGLGFESKLALPKDLSHVFESLDFLSTDTNISLAARGDGIKARHIPMILKFMADKQRALQGRGTVPYNFLWGYEEPENNLELASCIQLADQFVEYVGAGISQVFLTTHSPVFYNLKETNVNAGSDISCHHMILDEASEQEGTMELSNPSDLDERMGTMGLFAPLVESLERDIRSQEQAKRDAEAWAVNPRSKVFVEGTSDELIVRKALDIFARDHSAEIDVETKDSGGGWTYVVDMLRGWRSVAKHNGAMGRAAGIVDGDEDAISARRKWNQVNSNVVSAKCFQLPYPGHMHPALDAGFRIPADLELLYDREAWEWAEENQLLEARKLSKFIPTIVNEQIIEGTSTLDDSLGEEWSIFVKNRFTQRGKLSMAEHFSEMDDEEFRERMSCLEALVTDMVDYLFS